MNCYVINLKSQQRRRDWMTSQLEQQQIPFSIFDAINASVADPELQAFRDVEKRRHLSDPEVGCLLSHIGVWRRIAQGQDDFDVVLEDDVHLSRDFSDFLRTFPGDPREMALHKIETFRARVTLSRHVNYRAGHRNAHALLTNHGGTGAYILSRSLARELLLHVDEFRYAIDTELFAHGRRSFDALKIYQWTPAPCVQDCLRQDRLSEKLLESQISGAARFDQVMGRSRSASPFVHVLKNLLRRPYTRLYSLYLFPRGQMRAEIPYG